MKSRSLSFLEARSGISSAMESDIDLAIGLSPWPLDPIRVDEIRDNLKNRFERELDLIVFNQADPILAHEILSSGALVASKRVHDFYALKALKISEYIDFKFSRREIESNLMTKGWPKWTKKATP